MTLPVAFPSRRDTGSCVCEGNKLCCVVCRLSAPAGGEGRPGCCQRGTARRAGGSAGHGGARPAGCHSRTAFGPDPGRSARSGSRRCELHLSSAWCERAERLNYSLLLGLLFLLNSRVEAPCQHPLMNSLLRLPRGHPVCSGLEGAAACAGLALGLCSCGSVGLAALKPFHLQRRWAPAPSLLKGFLADLRVFLSVSGLQPC